jgi:small subunit ribosomal protein S4
MLLNGRKHTIPSATLKVGDNVQVREKSRQLDAIVSALSRADAMGRPAWVHVIPDELSGAVTALPGRDQIDATVNEQLIVEFYSR